MFIPRGASLLLYVHEAHFQKTRGSVPPLYTVIYCYTLVYGSTVSRGIYAWHKLPLLAARPRVEIALIIKLAEPSICPAIHVLCLFQ